MKLFGKEMSREQIEDRIGDISQLGGIKSYELTEGQSRGMRAIDMKTSAGLNITMLADRCLDISYLSYNSVPLCWRSAVPETHPAYFESRWDEWLRNYYGGFLTTCGFAYCGFPCTDDGMEYNIHGRASNLPAYNVCTYTEWKDNAYNLEVTGKIKEVKHGADKLEVTRKISTKMDEPVIFLEDRIKNIGAYKSSNMMLYHFNLGYPLIDTTSQVLEPGSAAVEPYDELSRKNFGGFKSFTAPSAENGNELYFHDIKSDSAGYASVGVVNEGFNNGQGIGVCIKYKKDTLPCLTQWKLLRSRGEYVCGIEPGTNYVTSIAQARKDNALNYIEPGQEKVFSLEIAVLTNKDDIIKFKNTLK